MKIFILFVALTLQSCTNFSIDVLEINKIKNIDSFQNKVFSSKNKLKVKNSNKKNIEKESEDKAKEIKNLWWEEINSKLLKQKIQILIEQNLDLKVAISKIEQAILAGNMAKNQNYPDINFNLNSARSKPSGNAYTSNSGYELLTSWEVEIFDHHKKKAKSIIKTTAEEKNSLKNLLITNLVKLYINISYNQKLLALNKKYLKISNKILNISKKRYEFGLKGVETKEIIKLQQEINQNRNELERIEKNIKDYSYQIDFILGQKIGTNNYKEKYFLPNYFKIINPQPNDIVSNRPDIRAIKTKIETAGENVSIAISDLYPDLSFGASSKISEESFGDFFDLSKLASSVFAQISFKIFAKGNIKNNIEIEKQKYKDISRQYAKKILQSFLEVEKALMLNNFYIKQEKRRKKNVVLAKKTETIYKRRYDVGTLSATEYLQTQLRTIKLQKDLLQIQQLKWLNYVSLNLAVGK